MGYMTRFTLNVQLLIAGRIAALEDETPLREVIRQLREENEEARYALEA